MPNREPYDDLAEDLRRSKYEIAFLKLFIVVPVTVTIGILIFQRVIRTGFEMWTHTDYWWSIFDAITLLTNCFLMVLMWVLGFLSYRSGRYEMLKYRKRNLPEED